MKWRLDTLVGDPSVFSIEHRVLNGLALVGLLLNVLTGLFSFFTHLPLATYLMPAVHSVFLLGIYVYSMHARKFRSVFWIAFLYLLLVFIPSSWMVNAGSIGGFPYFIFLFVIVVVTTARGLERFVFSALLLAG